MVPEASWENAQNLIKFRCENGAVERAILLFSVEASSKTLALSGLENVMIVVAARDRRTRWTSAIEGMPFGKQRYQQESADIGGEKM